MESGTQQELLFTWQIAKSVQIVYICEIFAWVVLTKLEMRGKAQRIAHSKPQCRPLANNNETHSLIVTLPSSPALPLKSPQKKFRRRLYCTTSYVLNSGITKPYLTKFLQHVQEWLLITLLKSKLRSFNLFRNAKVTNGDRRQIAAESRQKLCVLKLEFHGTDTDIRDAPIV